MRSAAPARSEHLGTVQLAIPNRAEWVAVARLAVAAIANRLTFSVEEIEDVKLAIAEACTNCIQQSSSDGVIAITCQAFSDFLQLTVVVGDRSVDLDDRDDRPVMRTEDPRMEGLGIFLIESIMDEVTYKPNPGGGSRLEMTKRVVQ